MYTPLSSLTHTYSAPNFPSLYISTYFQADLEQERLELQALNSGTTTPPSSAFP